MDTAERIRAFIHEEIAYGDPNLTIGNDTPLYEGLVDSIGLMDLVAFLEEQFGIVIEDEDLQSDNFRTVAAIERLVRRRAGAA